MEQGVWYQMHHFQVRDKVPAFRSSIFGFRVSATKNTLAPYGEQGYTVSETEFAASKILQFQVRDMVSGCLGPDAPLPGWEQSSRF
jgi:hypothetical protein